MSFILDALKKSESDRQRQSGPALFEVKVAPPKARFPVWAVAIVALLVVNMIIVGWMLLRRPSHADETTAANTPQAAASAGPAPAVPNNNTSNNTSAPVAPQVVAGAPSQLPPSNSAPANSMPPGSAPGGPQPAYPQPSNMSPGMAANVAPASAPAPSQGQFSAPSNQQGMGAAQPRIPERDQNEPTLASNANRLGNARDAGGANSEPAADPGANPDDYAPAADPNSPMFKGHVKRGTESGLPLYQDAATAAGSNLPQLRLDLHVYAAKPQDRFALINMHKMREGDSLQGGVRVESITPDGVVMSQNGSKFLLPRD